MGKVQIPVRYQQGDYWCTPACLQMVEASFGRRRRQAELAKALRTNPKKGTYSDDLLRYLVRSGYRVKEYVRISWTTLSKLIKLGARVILAVWGKILWRNTPGDYRDLHHVVLTSVGPKRCGIIDPYRRYGGRRRIPRSRLEASIMRVPGIRAVVIWEAD